MRYADKVALNTAELSLANVGVHTIDTGNAPPVQDVLQRQSPEMLEITRKAVIKIEQAKVALKKKKPLCKFSCCGQEKDR